MEVLKDMIRRTWDISRMYAVHPYQFAGEDWRKKKPLLEAAGGQEWSFWCCIVECMYKMI